LAVPSVAVTLTVETAVGRLILEDKESRKYKESEEIKQPSLEKEKMYTG
jgi:hypothetical protein